MATTNQTAGNGKKTYIAAGIGILTAVGGYYTGEMDLGTMINTILTSVVAITLRLGMKNEVDKVK